MSLSTHSLVRPFAVAALFAATLTACGKQETPAPSPAPAPAPAAASSAPTPTPAPAPAAANEASATTAQESKPLKIAFAYIGPVGDGGWTYAHDNGRKALEAALGDKVQTKYVESVPESADAERILRGFAAEGNDIIFGTTFGYMDYMVRLAQDFPNVKFEHATGYKTAGNLATYDSRTYEGAYLAGIIAGGMTQSNVVGVVGSVPIPEVIRNINSFTLGAQSVNPKITTKVVWVNEWFNPPKETEAATSLINSGADILFQNTDSAAVLKTAQDQGKRAFGWDSDMTAYGPKAHLGSAVINWGPYYIKTAQDAVNGNWSSGQHWWGVKEGAIDIVSLADDIPQEIKDKVAQAKQGLKDGTFSIWKGPIVDQEGKEVLTADQVADDGFLLGIKFYVKGVEGKVPGAN
ncbi:BMP family ABC transporter substrate-binding protein [Lampropedia puyangensis]|uniref:BMP family ABC transporter substrate-binding protein n=1 Tax=Lampropedia puyangensis TaxID=1330072 RepID=A0A4S8EXJ8_9BURK|nr:BMP family ABC transporter substrate-binding protein [Lampropedia puyangensis]THT99268.1 BMP family ABC transporter substrate-binding protein [Lampropedia puyangensis]